MQIKDKGDYIAGNGKFVVCILGNVVTRDFELVDLEFCPLAPEVSADFTARELGYCGTLGFVGGQFRSALDVPLDRDIVEALSRSYLELIVGKLANGAEQGRPASDGVDWLKKLYALPDSRDRAKEN